MAIAAQRARENTHQLLEAAGCRITRPSEFARLSLLRFAKGSKLIPCDGMSYGNHVQQLSNLYLGRRL